jgi:hypothetical protein
MVQPLIIVQAPIPITENMVCLDNLLKEMQVFGTYAIRVVTLYDLAEGFADTCRALIRRNSQGQVVTLPQHRASHQRDTLDAENMLAYHRMHF